MRTALLLFFCIHVALLSSCQNEKMEEYTNHLINESSPYLLQHAHNPVNWYPWSKEALDLAKKDKKLIIVSIGYAACRWCHVMEHECFEDTTVARVMNDHYISIKVDREERPDVDQVYMDAANLMTGSGGWPLNIIALPDGRPIYAGTYFPRAQWLKVLSGVQDFYEKKPNEALKQADRVQKGVKQINIVPDLANDDFDKDGLEQATWDWINTLDFKEGGRTGNMKFPMPRAYQVLLNYSYLKDNAKGMQVIKVTLKNMAWGGIYDQLGGGFARYSVDPHWNVPHFEKMLYDNAQLISLYSNAFKLTRNPLYKRIIEGTIAFCQRELLSRDGGYFSSLDADSEGEEGKYYIWTMDDIVAALGDHADSFMSYYGVTKNGNWEGGKNVLRLHSSLEEFSKKHNLDPKELSVQLKVDRQKLMDIRQKRIRPSLDDKILTTWNGLMISGLAHAYEALGDESYRMQAIATMNFIMKNMWADDHLNRNYKDGKSTINGFIDDYAFTIRALIDLYQITFNEKWLKEADKLVQVANQKFFDSDKKLYAFKDKADSQLYVAKYVVEDNVIPSGNSTMALNLFDLGHFLYKEDYIDRARNMLGINTTKLKQYASYYYNWYELYDKFINEPYEVAIVGPDADALRKKLSTRFLPNVILLGGMSEGNLSLLENRLVKGKTMIYVCVNKVCKLPVEDVTAALAQMKTGGE